MEGQDVNVRSDVLLRKVVPTTGSSTSCRNVESLGMSRAVR